MGGEPEDRVSRQTHVTETLLANGGLAADAYMASSATRAGWSADRAVTELYAMHYRALVRLAALLVRDTPTAEEVVQDSFVAVHQRWHKLGRADLPAYLRQTVVNRCRSAQRHLRVVDRHPPDAPGTAPGADEPLLADARRRAVLDALEALPRRQREVLALRYYLDLSEREIAETLDISQGAVKSHASRGAAALRATLAGLMEDS